MNNPFEHRAGRSPERSSSGQASSRCSSTRRASGGEAADWIPSALLRSIAVSAIALATILAGALGAASLHGLISAPSGEVLAGAQVRLFDRNSGQIHSVSSMDDGRYSFPNVPDGEYLLTGESADEALAGYRQIAVEGEAEQDLQLAVSGGRVEVVVTASSTPLTQREVAKALDAVDSLQIADRNEFALSEALRAIPGVRIRQLRGPGSFTTVQTRGLRNHDTAVLIDGLRFRDAASTQGDASAFYSDMNLVGTDRVEFVRGSGSSLYGSHAIGGVMNVTSAQGGGGTHGELRTEGGGLGMLRGVARVGGGLANDRFVYSGGGSHLNVTGGYRGRSPSRNTTARGFGKYALSQKLSLTGRVWGADAFLSLTESPAFPAEIVANFPDSGNVPARALPLDQLDLFEQRLPFSAGNATFVPGAIDPDNRRSSSFSASAVTLRHQLTAESSYRIAYQHVATKRSYQDGPAGPGLYDPVFSNDSRFNGQTHLLQARTDQRVGAHNLLSLGYELEAEKFANLNTDESPQPTASQVQIDQISHAVFGQDQIRMLDGRLLVSLSGRLQRFDPGSPRFGGATSPYETTPVANPGNAYTGDVAAAYFIEASQTKLRAHAGNAFRAPSMYERFGGSFSSYSGGFNYWGDPRLGPERSVAVDGGVDQWLYGSRVRLSGTFFYTNLQETVIFDFANFPANDIFGRFGGYRTSGGGIARGFELGTQISPTSSTSLRGAYTFTNSDSRTPTIGPDYFSVPGISNQSLYMAATQWLGKRVNVTFDLFALSDYVLSPYGAQGRRLVFSGPVKADLVVRYDLPLSDSRTLEVYGKAENVFNNDYYENGFGSPGLWVIGGMRLNF
ncbi:MAG: TonB-dependent receptor [Acidobacteriia bacterium]|nr:TonB-dependent receptor [Terriglobia bacterium]MYG01177.1 TonB-dependent receptor [Terriglobia bacterium]MYK12416.1 TonB-dependent receptor [Terriglobia bacterium]